MFPGSSAQECPHLKCVVYSSSRAYESETNAQVVIGIARQERRMRVFLSSGIRFRSAAGRRTQVDSFERRSRGMTQEMSRRDGQLTPEQAREGHRWIRHTVLAAVLQAWMMTVVVALLVPHLLALFLALGAAYSLAAPLLFRYLNRDIERRVVPGAAADGLVRLARTAGLPSSSGLSTPPR